MKIKKKGIVSGQELKKINYGRNEDITCITLICSLGGIIDCSGKI